MKQQVFEEKYGPRWERFERELVAMESSDVSLPFARSQSATSSDPDSPADFPQLYREICRDLSLAVQRRYSQQLLDRLNALALGGHRQLAQASEQLVEPAEAGVARVVPQARAFLTKPVQRVPTVRRRRVVRAAVSVRRREDPGRLQPRCAGEGVRGCLGPVEELGALLIRVAVRSGAALTDASTEPARSLEDDGVDAGMAQPPSRCQAC